jgi:histidine triad (HIT) family protein
MNMTDSIFTKIINREITADIIFEDDDVIAFNDVNPQAPVHILIVPKMPIPTINDLKDSDEKLLGKIILTAKRIAKEKGIDVNGYRLVFNCNEWAGQTVFHLHCHLLGGRVFNWPPG